MGKGDEIGRSSIDLTRLYEARFTQEDLRFKNDIWEVLVEDVFQQHVRPLDTVLELGAGRCEFINAIECGHKIAVDLDPSVRELAVDAEVLITPSHDLSSISRNSVDMVFTSNFFEHLSTKDVLIKTLQECHRVLRPEGKLITLQPNIRYLPGRYWDYLDHHIPLTHLSFVEALKLAGFRPTQVVPRFLPYTVKNTRLPRSRTLLKAYLRAKPLWYVLGRQMLIFASPD